ncbi:HAD family hydrolase [Propylenella binzhouense]|uniref:phosphoglycolate phosphatase n=1 Tax=Propylenella binzhouense TaxID=2555902 RepID=A0A964WTN0_9HYPH|nr:HAD family hydrolase [Propylenella binzhouense]MYZ48202.1 HAD family hydrolase [Propylenella binzhouense]
MSARRPPPLQAVLFDKDGTLADFQASWPPIFRRLAHELAEGDAARAERLLVQGGMDPLTSRVAPGSVLGAGNSRDIVDLWFPAAEVAERARLEARVNEVFVTEGVEALPIAGLGAMLDLLRMRGFRLGVATNDSTAAARAWLGRIGLADRFEAVIGYDAVANPKPAPDMVESFCRTAGVDPGGVLMVGDNLHDLHMARSAGAGAAVGVLTGNGRYEDLAPHADAVLQAVVDLPSWLFATD